MSGISLTGSDGAFLTGADGAQLVVPGASISLTETNLMTALRSFLLSVLPVGTECIRGQTNRTPEPAGPDFLVMTPILRERLETNISAWQDGWFQTPKVAGTRTDMQPTKATIQIDVHGPNSADNAQIVTTLFRSEVATTQFTASGYDVAPLYTSDPRQIAFNDGEQQIEERWTIDAVLQMNPVVTTLQDFAATLTVGLVDEP